MINKNKIINNVKYLSKQDIINIIQNIKNIKDTITDK